MDQMELVKNNDTMPCKRNFNSDDEIEKNLHPMKKQTTKLIENRKCPYLDTINRHVLDFDFEKLCSVSLSRINVYACLVCGKYFQGRGTFTHANTHSFDKGHYVFINLQTLKFYCLPDNYEIIDSSLEDIKYVLKPTFTLQHIQKLEVNDKLSLGGATYLPGIVGLNNIKANDYCNVILQALSQVPQLRNYFLREESYNKIRRSPGDNMFLLVERFGELLRKLWNPRNFKSHVSPHEMLQAVVLCSSKRFQITEQGDPIDFLSWFLNALHRALGGTGKTTSSVVYRTFRGKMRIYSRKMPFVKKDLKKEEIREIKQEFQESLEEFFVKIEESSFLYLTVDLPSTPLFTDNIQNCIPQVPLYNILSKFDGKKEKEYKSGKKSIIKRFEITKLPPYLILYIKRFTKNTFFVEKNTTIVNFPMKNIDLSHILSPEVKAKMPNASYNLLACIVHDGDPKAGKGTYRVHVLHKGTGKWFEMQDLHVTEILPQMIPLSEAYIQIYELRKQQGTSESDQ